MIHWDAVHRRNVQYGPSVNYASNAFALFDHKKSYICATHRVII